MPIYEYHCQDCGRKTSILILNINNPAIPSCQKCGSKKLKRILSRFARLKSEEDRLESMADPSKFGDLDENNPQSIAKWIKKMGKELGEDMSEDIDQAVEDTMQEGVNAEGFSDEEAAEDLPD